MCRFKSGIIFKNRVVIAQGCNDSHSDLLEELKIADTTENAMKLFVRAELLPPQNKWWSDPDTWEINVDQDIVPEWYSLDPEKYHAEFRAAVKAWWKEHVLIDQQIDELSSGYYRIKGCTVKKLLQNVVVMCDSSTVEAMYDNSVVQVMRYSSTVEAMYGSSTVQRMYNNSVVQAMYDNSVVQVMRDSSTVQRMYNDSIAKDYANGIIRYSRETKLTPKKHANL